MTQKHENYELLNLIGYGLAKFEADFYRQFGCQTKQDFFKTMVAAGCGNSVGTIKNRQDLFDPFFDNLRRGWFQKGDAYKHRKVHIDTLFGDMDVSSFAHLVQTYITGLGQEKEPQFDNPIVQTKYRKLQETGLEAELYFMTHYTKIPEFAAGQLEDARLWGDGYDFQVKVGAHYYLAEVKGVRSTNGSIRMTSNEYNQAQFHQHNYGLVIVHRLNEQPKFRVVFNPVQALELTEKTIRYEQIFYETSSW